MLGSFLGHFYWRCYYTLIEFSDSNGFCGGKFVRFEQQFFLSFMKYYKPNSRGMIRQ
jgi:hypothetical protein